ncbi:MAG: hypothetical protein GY925_20440 [Actinomycetia bacterium]|nr:hypothetical protein [Actinomycetes bacterium]
MADVPPVGATVTETLGPYPWTYTRRPDGRWESTHPDHPRLSATESAALDRIWTRENPPS